jgi:hypothetical protein
MSYVQESLFHYGLHADDDMNEAWDQMAADLEELGYEVPDVPGDF